MSLRYRRTGRAFSLVELLAVVLILAVLAAVASPLYLNTRKTSTARTCKGSLAAIAAAESAFALRHGVYGDMANLVGASEGLAAEPKCPLTLGGSSYTITDADGVVPHFDPATDSGGSALAITVACPNAAAHAQAMGSAVATTWSFTMPPPTGEGASSSGSGSHGHGNGNGNGNGNGGNGNGNGGGNGNGIGNGRG